MTAARGARDSAYPPAFWYRDSDWHRSPSLGPQVELHPGESVLAPRQVAHTFSAVSAVPARPLIGFCPAGKMDQYFRDVPAPRFAQAHLTAMQDPEFFRPLRDGTRWNVAILEIGR